MARDLAAVVFMFGFGMFLIGGLIKVDGRGAMQVQAIERGYALHCPEDGRFAWVGECGE